MILTKKNYYIIRIGDFATNANTKIYYSLFTTVLSLDDYYHNQSLDCFKIMIYSTLIWSLIEFFLHITNTRVIKSMRFYFCKNQYILPNYIGIFLQGFQEGGCVTTIGLYFGDRLNQIQYLIFLHLLIGFIVLNVSIKTRINNCSSKRLVNSRSSLTLLSLISLYNLKILYVYPEHLQRQLKMLFVMIYISSFWTLTAWYKGFRQVELYIPNKDNVEIIQKQSYFNTLYILSYDVVFEIGMAYLFFYNFLIT